MELIWSTSFAVICSIGGGGAIVGGVVKWCSNIIADKLSQKYAKQLSEELEKYKAELDKRKYISNKKFEVELSIYRDLVKTIVDMTETAYLLFPSLDYLPPNKEEAKKILISRYERSIDKYNHASEILFKNAPFINESIYQKCLELHNDCREHIHYANLFRIASDADENCKQMSGKYRECWRVSDEVIVKKRTQLITELRKYLESLEVIC